MLSCTRNRLRTPNRTAIGGGPQGVSDLQKDLKDAGVDYSYQEEPGTWIGPVVMLLLPGLIP